MNREQRWSNAVYEQTDGCIHCGSSLGSAHHIIPRGCQRTKYVLENGIWACEPFHQNVQQHKRKKDGRFIRDVYVSKERLDNLKRIQRGEVTPEEIGYTVIE